MPPTVKVFAEDPRQRITRELAEYWRKRETGWTPARLLAEMPREDGHPTAGAPSS